MGLKEARSIFWVIRSRSIFCVVFVSVCENDTIEWVSDEAPQAVSVVVETHGSFSGIRRFLNDCLRFNHHEWHSSVLFKRRIRYCKTFKGDLVNGVDFVR